MTMLQNCPSAPAFDFVIEPRSDFTESVEWPAQFSDCLASLEIEAIKNFSLYIQGSTRKFSEFFQVSQAQRQNQTIESNPQKTSCAQNDSLFAGPLIELRGDFSRVIGIGRGWKKGELLIAGNTGDCLGEQMQGGVIKVLGDSSDCAGRGMRGGRIVIQGNAGNDVGGVLPGQLRGMTGGEIFVFGSAGDFVGERMRRGTIAIQGKTGKQAGKEMLAGTIVLGSTPADLPGYGMKRGSIIILESGSDRDSEFRQKLAPLFQRAVGYQPVFVSALLKHLTESANWPEKPIALTCCYDRYSGDILQGNRGEILVRC